MANKGKNNNKLKRKRGKKFRFFDSEEKANEASQKAKQSNPFEEHHVTKRAEKDKGKVR